MNTQEITKNNITPCDIIFKHISKPDDYLDCKSINLYDDRWRVNIYSKRLVNGIDGQYISKSYFVHFNKASGNIRFVSPQI